MDFDLEYKLKNFRQEAKSLFDEHGERFSATPISDSTAKIMLQLINEMDEVIARLEDSVEDTKNF